jgi:N-methylhydantoinase A
MLRVALDIGGTFTDFVAQDTESGRMAYWKSLSTPSRPAEAVLSGLQELLGHANATLNNVDDVVHATTIAANAIIERKGSLVGLITTRGFRDTLIIGRQKRYETYNLFLDKPVPLARRRLLHEVDERIAHDGTILQPLDSASVDTAIEALVAEGVESIAVVLLHSYANPVHERAIRERIRTHAPQVSVSLSSEVSPKYREYERTSTTVANAYVKPIVDRYLSGLQSKLADQGFRGTFFAMQSGGGLATPEVVKEYPVRIVESGPAAGVLLCSMIGREEGFKNILTFDMGGTTAKLGAIAGGEPAVAPTFEVDTVRYRKGSGLPLSVPAIELLEIGAGGGSIATTKMGLIEVGPESAGADPGPICYGQKGERVTVTDANLILGYLNPDYFNAGAFALDREAAEKGIREQIAGPLGLSVGEAAWGIHTVANSNMEAAMRVVSVERGRDPREYGLVAFGGAGPAHAARLARALGIRKLIIPHGAGVGSAVGLLTADTKFDVSMTRILSLTAESSAEIADIYEGLEVQAREIVEQLGELGEPKWSRYAYMRYSGQGHELKVDLPEGRITNDYAVAGISAFQETYKRNYGYTQPDTPVEAVDWYLVASIPSSPTPPQESIDRGIQSADKSAAEKPARQAYFTEIGGYVECAVVDRYMMTAGMRIIGPAVVEERESTTVVLPGDEAFVSENGHLIIEIGEES